MTDLHKVIVWLEGHSGNRMVSHELWTGMHMGPEKRREVRKCNVSRLQKLQDQLNANRSVCLDLDSPLTPPSVARCVGAKAILPA
jgi:hypothetical protein